MKARIVVLLIAASLIALGMWSISRRGKRGLPPRAKPDVAIQDGKTIDFSSGKPQVKDNPTDKAALDRSVAEINAASANVTFTPKPTPAAPIGTTSTTTTK